MILFTNGCSWTWGGGLDNHFIINNQLDDEKRSSLVWPHHLGKLINASTVVNLSMGCGSNQRIVRTTYDWFLNNYDGVTPIVAIIQWTEFCRYEYYATNNIHDFSNKEKNWALVKPGVLLTQEFDEGAFDRTQIPFSTYTDIEGMYRHVRDCTSLAYLFNKLNVKYYFWTYSYIFANFPKIYRELLRDLNYIDFECMWKYDRISPHDAHPSILGHQQLADLIYKEIKF